MATEGAQAGPASQRIDERLDAIDRSLLGVLPRAERLELVAKIESRIRELLSAGDAAVEAALEGTLPTTTAREGLATQTPKRRSRLALTAGIVGLVSVAMMIALPLAYILGSMRFDQLALSEEVVLVLLAGFHLATLLAGSTAIVLGIAGLIAIARRQGKLFGSGWAVTGLCTGPLPVMAAGLPLLLFGLQFLVASNAVVTVNAAPSVAVSAPYRTYPPSHGPVTSADYQYLPSAPTSLPAQYSAAPATPYPDSAVPPLPIAPAPTTEPATVPPYASLAPSADDKKPDMPEASEAETDTASPDDEPADVEAKDEADPAPSAE